MTRWALGVEYDGARFCGWQSQAGVPTVQDALERALAQVACAPIRVVAAGRTDTGVHALGQVVHFDSDAERRPEAFVRGTNAHLGCDVAVLWARVVPDDFHARFSARARRYRYLWLNRRVRPALFRDQVSFEYRPLDTARMEAAAAALIGRHDFSAFRAAQCQAKTPVRTIHSLTIERRGPLIVMGIHADAFLHHMVRNIAGVLAAIGAGERPVAWAAEVLASCERAAGGITASPHGLYLEAVDYPERFGIPVSSGVVGAGLPFFCRR
ncbi:tRNA pseudouridine(38-40) synthase TruA [Acidiferrobacter sp.]|uniref:tRNA pseudouridine(38-40) synthase TruA n=2 Tax=Acidiferrobacter sp. TaxID=1872107 RepID=UPI002631219F|nr:tRNA pseudouridine(38-40) synthase TruA [Acidiferrobacter sp.]